MQQLNTNMLDIPKNKSENKRYEILMIHSKWKQRKKNNTQNK